MFTTIAHQEYQRWDKEELKCMIVTNLFYIIY